MTRADHDALREGLAAAMQAHRNPVADLTPPFAEQDARVRKFWLGEADAVLAFPALAPLLAKAESAERVTAERDEARAEAAANLASQRYWSGEASRACDAIAAIRAEADRLAAENAALRADLAAAVNEVGNQARARGEAEGALRASELAGMVDNWRDHAKAEGARADRLAADVERALSEATRMDAILLMAGEMTAQERRTAKAVADGIAARIRDALRTDPPAGTDAPVKEDQPHTHAGADHAE